MATKPQGEKLFVAKRESIMQWEAEHQTRHQINAHSNQQGAVIDQWLQLAASTIHGNGLKPPALHLRACEIIEHAESLNRMASEAKRLGGQPGEMEEEPGQLGN